MAQFIRKRIEALAFALHNGLSLKQGLRELQEMNLQPRLHAHQQTSYQRSLDGLSVSVQTNPQTVHLHYRDSEWGPFQSAYEITSKEELIKLLQDYYVDKSYTVYV